MLIYHYNGTTKEYVTSNDLVLDPRTKKPMIPSNATIIEPPTTSDGSLPIFDTNTGTWSVVDDLRGVYYDNNGIPEVVKDFGSKPKTGSIKEKPPENIIFYEIKNNTWVFKTLDDIKQIKIDDAHYKSSSEMNKLIRTYNQVEVSTWPPLYTECLEYKNSGTVGLLMSKKIATSNVYDTADALVDKIIPSYELYLDDIFNIQTQRDVHKANINQITDKKQLMDYDSTVSI